MKIKYWLYIKYRLNIIWQAWLNFFILYDYSAPSSCQVELFTLTKQSPLFVHLLDCSVAFNHIIVFLSTYALLSFNETQHVHYSEHFRASPGLKSWASILAFKSTRIRTIRAVISFVGINSRNAFHHQTICQPASAGVAHWTLRAAMFNLEGNQLDHVVRVL